MYVYSIERDTKRKVLYLNINELCFNVSRLWSGELATL